jgi:hypothetical protein
MIQTAFQHYIINPIHNTFGKETKKAAKEESEARRMPEEVSHTGGLKASPKRHVEALAGVAPTHSTHTGPLSGRLAMLEKIRYTTSL